jgi:hypothetical protein
MGAVFVPVLSPRQLPPQRQQQQQHEMLGAGGALTPLSAEVANLCAQFIDRLHHRTVVNPAVPAVVDFIRATAGRAQDNATAVLRHCIHLTHVQQQAAAHRRPELVIQLFFACIFI